MFQIDRSYIDRPSLETLQGHIWDIRQDNKDNPTLPKIENYGISEEAFEQYLERKQHFEDFKESWRKYRLAILVMAFAIPVALFSLLMKGGQAAVYAYSSGLLICLLIYTVYQIIKAIRAKEFRSNPGETFIKALLSWEEAQQ